MVEEGKLTSGSSAMLNRTGQAVELAVSLRNGGNVLACRSGTFAAGGGLHFTALPGHGARHVFFPITDGRKVSNGSVDCNSKYSAV
jgi:hypothetical protein